MLAAESRGACRACARAGRHSERCAALRGGEVVGGVEGADAGAGAGEVR